MVPAMSNPPPKRRRDKDAPVAAPAERESEREVPPAADSDPAGRLLHRLRDRERDAAPRSSPPAEAALGPGARVRVLRGPFMGKSGVVQELDGRGGARVMLGLLSARIDLKDLATAADGGGGGGRERMTLSSSHRKPR